MQLQTALIQHPMYLLIREDTTCAERMPPWGEPTIELYIERIRTNLKRVREYPQIKIGFEWSALELELLALDAPDVFAEMCALVQEGRVAFYNGTYSQPHLQVQSAEANIRQFEFGRRVYQELCGHAVVTYAHQESSIHDQLPQILEPFGIQYSALPHFPSSLSYLDGGEILLRLGEPHFLHSQEFVRWVGLDGTALPLYLTPHRYPIPEWVTRETAAGMMSGPTLLLENRDLLNVSGEWLKERDGVEMVLLDDAFRERLSETPPQARARHFTYWSYTEGIRAEELSRKNWLAEQSTLRAEALDAMAFTLLGAAPHDTDEVWKSILASQHHDAHCFCAPELRSKAIQSVEMAAHQARQASHETAAALAAKISTESQNGIPLVVFHTLPGPQQEPVTVRVDSDRLSLLDGDGNIVPADASIARGGSAWLRFVSESKGLGYQTYWLQEGTPPRVQTESTSNIRFENGFYRAILQSDGTFSSLCVKPSNAELLAQNGDGSNFLRATDSTGISPQDNPGLVNKPRWQVPPQPPELVWQTEDFARLTTTPLGISVNVNGQLGESIRVSMKIDLYHSLPRIDFTYEFDFRDASVGIFYLDETKLRVGWHLGFQGEIRHDIPFGVIRTEHDLPILPTRWVDISDGMKGLAYFHHGTFKHWVKDNTLFNLFGWGEETNAIGDRIWRENWAKSFDQRLNGIHTIRAAVYPHEGDWRSGNVIAAAQSYNCPPCALLTTQHTGNFPSNLNLLTIQELELVPTSVRVQDSQVTCRVYSVADQPLVPTLQLSGLNFSALTVLNGSPISEIASYKIAEVKLIPAQAAP